MTSETVKYPRLLALINKGIVAKCEKILGANSVDFAVAAQPALVNDFHMDPAAAAGIFKGTVGITAAVAVFLGKELGLNPRALMDAQTDDELQQAGLEVERTMTKAEKKAAEKAAKPAKPRVSSGHSPMYGDKPASSAVGKVERVSRRSFDF